MPRKVIIGQRFRPKAGEWNAMIDAADAERRRVHDIVAKAERYDDGSIRAKNIAGDDVDAYQIVWLSGARSEYVEIEPVQYGWDTSIAIASAPIASGELGRVWVDGIRQALCDGSTGWSDGEFPRYAAVDPETSVLSSESDGPICVIGLSSSDDRVMVDLDRIDRGDCIYVWDGERWLRTEFIELMSDEW